MDPKTQFLHILKTEFAPLLRQEGFKGSGKNFYRIQEDLIHVLNLQSSSSGDSFAVNLGIHPLGMRVEGSTEAPEAKQLKEYYCLFRTRLAKPSKNDHWWKPKSLFNSPDKVARSLISYYQQYGVSYFAAFDCTVMAGKKEVHIAGTTMILGRAGMIGARIAEHLHEYSKAKELAEFAKAHQWPNWPFDDEVARLSALA